VTARQYVYRVTDVVKVTDGDTYWLRADVGFRQEILIDCRLDGWDCPETNRGTAYERAQAKVARAFSANWLTAALLEGLWIRTEKDPDDFGRWLGDLWTEAGDDEDHLGATLAAARLASAWPTRWREVYDTTL
jgi:endonuclease YncB( thermonuclease family)